MAHIEPLGRKAFYVLLDATEISPDALTGTPVLDCRDGSTDVRLRLSMEQVMDLPSEPVYATVSGDASMFIEIGDDLTLSGHEILDVDHVEILREPVRACAQAVRHLPA